MEERETKENITLLSCKNGQLTYHICNLILLPSRSIVLLRKSIPGEAKEGREGEVNNSDVSSLIRDGTSQATSCFCTLP